MKSLTTSLVHDRDIVRALDDSIVREICGNETVLRSARGYAPAPFTVNSLDPARSSLGVGGHLKNTVSVTRGDRVFISQHLGEQDSIRAREVHLRTMSDLPSLLGVEPDLFARDLHTDYASSSAAMTRCPSALSVQHHHAHVVSCMVENSVTDPVLGVVWDGTGLGTDNTIWGGEFLSADASSFTRIAHLRRFPLPGGDQAVREPRRAALGLLFAIYGEAPGGIPPVQHWTRSRGRSWQFSFEC